MMLSLTQGLQRAQQLHGDSLVVVDNEVRYDWNAVSDRVARLASVFRTQGVKEGDGVAPLAQNSHRSRDENVLMPHKHVCSCAVVGMPDDHWGKRVQPVVAPVLGKTPRRVR